MMAELEEDEGVARLPSSSEMSGEKRHDTGVRKRWREMRDCVPNRKVGLHFWITGSARSKIGRPLEQPLEMIFR
jgi:hypothetical protein